MREYVQWGNASADGSDFSHWFIGDLAAWAGQNGLVESGYGMRQTTALEVKWGEHAAGERRPGGWAASSEKTSLSVLVRGEFELRFRDPRRPDQQLVHRLSNQGDYVLWREKVEHTWQALQDAVILTVRWSSAR